MMKKIIVALVVLVAVLGIGFAAFGNSDKKINETNNSTVQEKNQTITSNNTANETVPTKISPSEAQKIATDYIKVSGVTVGTPTLVNQDNNMVYIVPLIDNGKNVGEIDIDANTGKNLGGAGGSP